MTNKIYNIIHLPDGYMYAVDKEKQIISTDKIITDPKNKGQLNEDKLYPIIATNNPNLELPLLPEIEENWKEAFNKSFPKIKDVDIFARQNLKDGFMEGYKTAKAKQYTNKDLLAAFNKGMDNAWKDVEQQILPEEYIKSLSPKPIAVELEMIDNGYEVDMEGRGSSDIGWMEKWEPKLINSFVNVLKWMYEKTKME